MPNQRIPAEALRHAQELLEEFDRIRSIRDGWFRFGSVDFSLASGRKFRYKLEDYPLRVGASETEIEALCSRIIKDKYRYCEWDRNHPRTNTEVEIFDALKTWMLAKVAKAQKQMAEARPDRYRIAEKPRVFASWGIFSGEQLMEEFPYKNRAEAERRLQQLHSQMPGSYQLRQLARTQEHVNRS